MNMHFIGAGSVVTKDVPPYHVVYGNPAKFKGLMRRVRPVSSSGKSGPHVPVVSNTLLKIKW